MVKWEKYTGGVGEVQWWSGRSIVVEWEKYSGGVGELQCWNGSIVVVLEKCSDGMGEVY